MEHYFAECEEGNACICDTHVECEGSYSCIAPIHVEGCFSNTTFVYYNEEETNSPQ